MDVPLLPPYFPGDMYGAYEGLHDYDIEHHPSAENIPPKFREVLRRTGVLVVEILYQYAVPGPNPQIVNPERDFQELNPFTPAPAEASGG